MSHPSQVEPHSAARFLRAATAQAHAQVEALPHMPELAAGTLAPSRYAQVLRCHLAILAPWERAHAPWLDTLAAHGWPYRRRAQALRHDLAALGLPADAGAGPAPRAEGGAQAWGMLYVVEGSMLGGRVIARQLRLQQPALAPALAYFDMGSADAGAWRQFQARLEAALPDPASRGQAAVGAAAMFAHFHHHLCAGMSA
jgi:heme oxygenase